VVAVGGDSGRQRHARRELGGDRGVWDSIGMLSEILQDPGRLPNALEAVRPI
jgi:hypothetical protein